MQRLKSNKSIDFIGKKFYRLVIFMFCLKGFLEPKYTYSMLQFDKMYKNGKINRGVY